MIDFYFWLLHFIVFLLGCWVMALRSEVRMNVLTVKMLRNFLETDSKYIKKLEKLLKSNDNPEYTKYFTK